MKDQIKRPRNAEDYEDGEDSQAAQAAEESESSTGGDPVVFTVDAAGNGERLDKFLAARPEIHSRSQSQRLIEGGKVTVDGESALCRRILRLGEVVSAIIPAVEPTQILAEPGNLEVLYEDEDLIVINKPSGMVVHPAPGNWSGTLVNYLLHHCKDLSGINGEQRPGIVHRLDKDTSGVLVAAKHDRAHGSLAKQFEEHTIKRVYRAVVWGKLEPDTGKYDQPLGRDSRDRLKFCVQEDGRRAVTHWKVAGRTKNFTLVRCRLETGRTHQIRVHLSHNGHPLVGDPVYGHMPPSRWAKLPEPLRQALYAFRRQALHAETLGFIHPMSGEFIEFSAPPPSDFDELVALAGRHDPA